MVLSVASTSTTTTGTSAAPTVNVPTGVAAGEGVLVIIHTNNAQTINVGATGFVHAPGSPLASSGVQFSLNVLFKVATGNDSGTYVFSTAGSDFWAAGASRITGGPSATWDTNSGTGTALVTGTTNTLNTSMTTQAANELLVGAGDQFNGGTWTFTGVTKVTDVDTTNLVAGYGALLKAVAGATGTITNATAGAASQMVAWLGALVPAAVSQPTHGPAVVSTPYVPRLPPGAQLFASRPLGNPAVGTRGPQVVSTPWIPLRPPGATLFASQPLGNPATPTPRPLVVSSPGTAKVPGALLFGPGAPPAVVSSVGTPGPLVVTPPFTPVPIPPSSITASQPLGNPAVGSPLPLVVSEPWTSKVPGALIFGPGAPTAAIVTGSTPLPLVVTPPFTPVPIPETYLSASQPLGNPATGTPGPLVSVPTFTLAPVTGAKVFAAPQAPAIVTAPTPGPLVVGPQWQPVAIPHTYLSASQPLGNPAVSSPRPLIVSPTFRWPVWTASLISDSFVFVAPTICDTPRPFTGTTTYGLATTARPGSGTTTYGLASTARPNTGETDPPCG